ncbi:MAG: alpha-2-macroglobulin family protein, partial [Planctomycetota bacterium]|nr:alpha-2-macroglobulin family protein [Planctomycetota bacterium]
MPELITDAAGRAQLEIPLADSITTWRLSMSAVSGTGELGSATKGLRVFQDFFVDIDFPVAL